MPKPIFAPHLKTVAGIAEKVGSVSEALGGLLGGKPATSGTNTTTTNRINPADLLNLFKTPKKQATP